MLWPARGAVRPNLLPSHTRLAWRFHRNSRQSAVTARGTVSLERPVILGILNVTPDSFSDGSRFSQLDDALAQADLLLADGAGMLDIGGESTRPGNPDPVPEDEELRRVIPLIEALVRRHPGLMLSVDTVKARVARTAIDAGASVINDVSAFRLDPAMAATAAELRAGVVLMHSRGTTSTMATLDHAEYEGDVVAVVRRELSDAAARAVSAGIPDENIVLDPGLGFAKTAEHNLLITDRLAELVAFGRPFWSGPRASDSSAASRDAKWPSETWRLRPPVWWPTSAVRLCSGCTMSH